MTFQQAIATIQNDLGGPGASMGGLKEDIMAILRPKGPGGKVEPAAIIEVEMSNTTIMKLSLALLALDLIGDAVKKRIK